LAKQATHGGGLGWLFAVTTLDAVLSLDGRNLRTSSCHLRRIRIDTTTLVVHAGKDAMSEVLPRRKMYWFGRGRDSDRAASDRTDGGNTDC
jgi:hypothetical protein